MVKKDRQNRLLRKAATRRGTVAPRNRSALPDREKYLLHTAVILAVSYVLILSAFSLVQHYSLRTQMADLGNADQAIWAASRGDLRMTISNDSSGDLTSRLTIHANILFLLIAPLYVVLPRPGIHLVLTTLASAAAGLSLFFIARHALSPGNGWTLVPMLLFYINPMVDRCQSVRFSYHHDIHGAFSDWANYAPNPYREQMMRITSEIPDNTSLCFQNNLAPHFSERRDIVEAGPRCADAEFLLYHIQPLGGPDYGMFYRTSDDLYRRTGNNVRVIARLLQSDAYGLIRQEERFYLFKKGASSDIPKSQALEQLDKDYRNAIKEMRASVRNNTGGGNTLSETGNKKTHIALP